MRATLSSGIGSLLSVMASHVRSSTSSGADAPYHLNPASPLGSVQILVKSDNPKIATANQSASEALGGHLKTGHRWTGQNRPTGAGAQAGCVVAHSVLTGQVASRCRR